MEKCIPQKILPSRRHNLPWLNKGIIQAIKRRNYLFKKAKTSAVNEQKYRQARNKVVSLLRSAKKEYFSSLNPRKSKQFWKSIKVVNRHNSTIPVLSQGPRTLSSDQEKADALNSFFSQCFNHTLPPLTPSECYHMKSCSEDLLCTVEEVTELLNSLDVSKASGPDGISARMLKATSNEIAPSITALFNLSIRCNRPPREWKKSHIVPVPKQKTSNPTPEDFRPISLLPILSKLLEKHIYRLISSRIPNTLSNAQWGFLSGRSTVQALLVTMDKWLQYLERGNDIGAVFFDFRKAFDSVPHAPLITKLQQLGLDPNIVSWVREYLSGRSQCVVCNGAASEYLLVISGVPQGSVLGPLLFLIYINDLTDLDISEGSEVVLYADDILLYRPVLSDDDFAALQSDINKIQTWAASNLMTFNVAKCKVMHVSRKRSPLSPTTPIMLNGSILEVVTTYKYLGLHISSDLSWSYHIQSICSKARKVLGLLYRKYYRFSDQATLLQLYTSLVRPHLEYAASVWDPYHQRDIQLLEKTQKFACRMCTKTWSASYHELLHALQLPTLSNRRLFLKLCTIFKIIHGACYFPPNVICVRDTRTHIGRPLMLNQPFARTNSYFYSFVPNSVSQWNRLPEYVISHYSVQSFKQALTQHLSNTSR